MKISKFIYLLFPILLFSACKKCDDISNVVVNNPAPVATSITPNAATVGGASFVITVNGSNFINGSVINWNGIALATTYISATQLTAMVPAANVATVGTVSVTVFTATPGGGTSIALSFTITSAVVNNPLPVLISLSPSTAVAGTASFILTATGTNYVNGSTINWNGIALTTTFVSATQLTAIVPATSIATTGTASITISSPAPGGGVSNAISFAITAAAVNNPIPTLITISPNTRSAGSTAFTITATGTSFINGSVINWNGTALVTTFVSVTQLTANVPASNVSTAGTALVTVFTPTPGGGSTSAINFSITTVSTTTKKFLFDASHAETAGNADWVIDEDNSNPQSIPTPAQSTIIASTPETYWTGAISSWGIALVKKGHMVETLPTTGVITYGNTSNTQDLSNYNVFVVDEPNRVFNASEKVAILNFVNNGGGLFMVSDHTGSDRDNDGWDSPAIWNDLMSNNTVQTNPFGFTIDLANFSQTTSNVLTNISSSVILSGSEGNVTQLQFNNGTSATINPAANPNVKGLIWKTGVSQTTSNIMSLSSTYGSGRVYFVGDSSPLDDGTGAPGNNLYVSWPLFSHTSLFMNASLWLAKVQ